VRLDLKLNQKLDLQLRLAPQIIQSIELLQLPAMDLVDLIEQELDTNEFLEKVMPGDEGPEKPAATESTSDTATEEQPAPEAQAERDAEVERYEQMDIWDDPSLRRRSSRDDESLNAKFEAMQNTASNGPSLQDALLEQYQMLDLDERYLPLAEQIVYNLDSSGYLAYPLEEVLEDLADQFSLAEAEYVLSQIQRLEPRGVGARSREECLLLQLDPGDPDYELEYELVTKHLGDVDRNRLPKVARALGISMDEFKHLLQRLSALSLNPGSTVSEEPNHYIQPDVIVEWTGHGYDVRLANEYVPELRLNPEYRHVLGAEGVSKDYRDYVKKKVDNARAFIMAVEKRQRTLLEVARRIVHYQHDFLDFGTHYLHPLKMQQVADDLGVHVSTVSRATSDKYMQTHRGIFSMKDFFTGGTRSVDGSMESRESVKQKVKEIIEREDKSNPLSDDEIVDLLHKNNGVKVARRTVTKYRKSLGILSSRQRREY
jgi:RNA polymerase sigma-54 factor